MNQLLNEPTILELKKICYAYSNESKNILQEYSLKLPTGQTILFTGNNGSGKTTILKILGGLIPQFCGGVFSGTREYQGEMYDSINPFTFGFILQNQNDWFIHNQLDHEIFSILENAGMDEKTVFNNFKTLVQCFDLENFLTKKLDSLSSGEKQWIKIALGFVLDPKIVLMDEPLIHLDSEKKKKMTHILQNLKNNKRLTYVIADQTSTDWTTFDPIIHQVGKQCSQNEITIHKHPLNHETTPLVSFENVSFSYPGVPVFQDLNFTIQKGQCVAILGPNGSGKTTILNMMMGNTLPKSGFVHFYQSSMSKFLLVQPTLDNFFSMKVNEELQIQNSESTSEAFGERYVFDLSHGEQTYVSHLLATVSKANFLLLDEPWVHGDSETIGKIIDGIQTWINQGKTVVFTSHDSKSAEQIADQTINLE